jgi:hypothetical protein
MNKQAILELNAVPEGKAAWLNYENYLQLEQLFEAVEAPGQGSLDPKYAALYDFLVKVAGLTLRLPRSQAAIHFNAFTLLRRGYAVEEITETEYKDLVRLMSGLEQPVKTDMDLYDFGGHRDLYNYLTKQMGLFVPPGRGPAWYRAQALIEKYRLPETAPHP